MAFRRYASAETGIDIDRHIRQRSLEQHGVGDDTNIGADANQGDGCERPFGVGLSNCVCQSGGAEGWLFKTLGILHTQRTGHGIIERPAVAAFLAVNDWQIVPFLGFEIIAFVGVEGVEYGP